MSFAKTYSEARGKFKPMSRKAMKRGTKQMKRGTKRLGPGKKTKQWNSARAIIKRRFEAVGITTCELQGKLKHDCGIDNYLGFAHDAKRRKLSEAALYHVILICNFAHDIIEVWPAEKMKAIVNDTIQQRRQQPS